MAEERGIVVEEKSVSEAQDFNELIRVTVVAGGERVAVAGTGIGPAACRIWSRSRAGG